MKNNEDYLNGLITKAKKSWEGVDVDSFMSELRDMDAVTVKCRDLMVGDWVTNEHGLPAQIINVDNLCAFTIFGSDEDDEGEPWVFDDKDCQPSPIEITTELLKANGWNSHIYYLPYNFSSHYETIEVNGNYLEWEMGGISIWFNYNKDNKGVYSDILVPCNYVHQLQQVLRLAGMTELANNFKVK